MARRPIAGLRVIVSGASSGIGRELARQLCQDGAKVVALARRADRLEALAEELAVPNQLVCLAGDVTQPADRRRALDEAQRKFGGLDALVNNAGRGAIGPFAAADPSRLREIFEVNFFAAVEFIREALPLLRQGTTPIIVNVSSVLGHRAVPRKSEYCASKFALHGFSDALRAELAAEGIDVLLASPSTTESEFFTQAVGDNKSRPGRFGVMTAPAVARCIVAAMRAGKHEIILSAGGNFLVWLDRLCPPLANWIMARWG